jgi:hypothetical protein
MSSSEIPSTEVAIESLSDEHLQVLLARATKEYATRCQAGRQFPVFGSGDAGVGLTATDAVIMASAVLDALSVEIFELGMWKTWGGA